MASSALSRIANLQKHFNPTSKNLETAKEVEAIIRQNGAIPATIAILDGLPCVEVTEQFTSSFIGIVAIDSCINCLSVEELERLAILGRKAQKTARRDIAHVVATGGNGATTVSATMFFAAKVGIAIFVTGGIGGVHRHGESTLDISSDLTELGRTPVAVVSAGVKSILDIPRTLEYLETQGVCVAAYQTNEFPAFFTEKSGCKAPSRVDSLEDCARLIDSSINLGLTTGILIALPIPREHSASGNIIESAIQKALKEAREQNVTGSAETPFLLARVLRLRSPSVSYENIDLKVPDGEKGFSSHVLRS
ncbi:UNVERIFIED_CONTAM: Pseudouridine-5'-phosphate glycosidase [Sesamum radiatum]|uniref:Pseudouridine-5'-phosphate glycosidase n=1 Tax=Sesamum radiatum TaxID=300843 RepID=A0AAW2USN9_SESRA